MQKLTLPSRRAKNAYSSAIAKQHKASTRLQRTTLRREAVDYNRQKARLIKASKIARREDWELGPLAPRRDVGLSGETYGTLPSKQLKPTNKMRDERRNWGIHVGDRVCVTGTEQRERGKIGKVIKVDNRSQTCVVGGVNVADFPTPAHLRYSRPNQSTISTHAAPLPLASVRLVHSLINPQTNKKTDTIIDSLTIQRHKRYMTGTDTIIPWPPGPDRRKPEEYDIDTLRIDVEDSTWIPKLLTEPFPGGVIDELRGKYSAFRDRHEDSYTEFWEERENEWKERDKRKKAEMRTPMEEWALLRQREKEQSGEPTLNEEVLERIGKTMAKNKGLELENRPEQRVGEGRA